MKLDLFFALVVASANAFAQQPRPDQAPRAIELPVHQAPIPRPSPPQALQPSNAELSELLRAQTTAIKSLSSKVDSLEERIRKIEQRPR